MNWKLVFTLSAIGLIMGTAAVLGVTGWIEAVLWLLVGIACAWIIARNVSEKHFSHGFVVGFINSAIAHIIQILFFDTLAENNPDVAARLASSEAGLGELGPRTFVLVIMPFISITSGLLLGFFTWIAGKVVQPPAEVEL
jgi:hypothetical protein